MAKDIISKLNTLVEIGKLHHAGANIVITEDKGRYKVILGIQRGAHRDMVRVHRYLEQAGLTDHSRNPQLGGDGIVTSEGRIALGSYFGKTEEGIGNAVLSDNINVIVPPASKDFGLDIGFGNRSNDEVVTKLDEALRLAKMDKHLAKEREQGKENLKKRVKKADHLRDTLSKSAQHSANRNDQDDIEVVRKFVTDMVHELAPSARVEVHYNSIPEQLDGFEKPTFRIRAEINDKTIDHNELIRSLNMRIREKFEPNNNRPQVMHGFYFFNRGWIEGEIQESAARAAAQIEGEYPKFQLY